MKRVETVLSTQQYAEVQEFCKKHGLSVYALLKIAVLDHIGLKTLPPGTPGTSEMTDREASVAGAAESLSTMPKERMAVLTVPDSDVAEAPFVETKTSLLCTL